MIPKIIKLLNDEVHQSLKALIECPECNLKAWIDQDQYYGEISIDCPECEFHKTINFNNENNS